MAGWTNARPRARPRARWWLAAGAAVALAGGPALAAPPPADVARAIDQAIAAAQQATANAAFSAALAKAPSSEQVAQRTGARILQSALVEAVVEGIYRYPGAVEAIVHAAVTRAPAYRDAVVRRAKMAFPAFAARIDAGAGVTPAVRQATPARQLAPPPATAAAPPAPPRSAQSAPPLSAQPAAPLATWPQTAAAPAAEPAIAEATGKAWWYPSELRIGAAYHDAGVFGRHEENSDVDAVLEVRLQPLTGGLWEILQQPRPAIGANINTEGDTSSVHLSLDWEWQPWRALFFGFDLGGTVHDGKTKTNDPNTKELGSRVLFYLAAEVGYVFAEHHALSLRLDHMSNASLASRNEGLDTVALVYGYRF